MAYLVVANILVLAVLLFFSTRAYFKASIRQKELEEDLEKTEKKLEVLSKPLPTANDIADWLRKQE